MSGPCIVFIDSLLFFLWFYILPRRCRQNAKTFRDRVDVGLLIDLLHELREIFYGILVD